MPNITLSVDSDVVKKVRKVAIERNTTLTAMVREYLESVARKDELDKQARLRRLRQSFETLGKGRALKAWRREDLYDRKVLR